MLDTTLARLVRASLVGLVALATGCAATEDVGEDVGSSSDELAGTTFKEIAEPGVVAIVFQDAAGNQGLCTGELVAPRVVLTAAHCTAPAKAARVYVGASLDAVTESAEVAQILTHPAYAQVADLTVGWSDIGAMVLKTPLAARPIPIRRSSPAALVNRGVKLVGFGTTKRDDATTIGPKRSGFAIVGEALGRELWVPGGPGFASGCSGDSGGPALAFGSQGWELVGIESHGDVACEKGSFKTRLDVHLPFVDAALALGR